MADETTTYVVTDVGGPRPIVGGRMRTAGKTVELTALQAEFELKRGTICTPKEWDARKAAAEAAAEDAKA